MSEINTHGMVCDFGRHRGQLITRVPVNYLFWMVNSRHSRAEVAVAELKRRGSIMPTVDLSGHSIDRASLRCLDVWKRTRNEDEGIHAWLQRMAAEAHNQPKDPKGRHHHEGMLFQFEEGEYWPTLKTVMVKSSTYEKNKWEAGND